jgi:hypothetical protein
VKVRFVTRKTGKMAVKARQLARAAKLARYKRELYEAGVSLSLPKPSAKARKEKEEELKRLYLELFHEKKQAEGEVAESEAKREDSAERSEEAKETQEQAGNQ